MRRFRRITLIALIPTLLLVLCFLVNCIGEGWLDDGSNYLCSECRELGALCALGSCERCGTEVSTISYKYCYDCTKELNCCQRCGVER